MKSLNYTASRTIIPLGFLLFFCFGLVRNFAQSPTAGISYQAVVRDGNAQLVKNTNITLRISILRDSDQGPIVYQESQQTNTNPHGLMSIHIGKGQVIAGQFQNINWGQAAYFLRTEIDLQGGSQYALQSVSELTAVPFAYHAKTVENADDADADPFNELQTLQYANHQLTIDQGNTVDLSSLVNTDQQVLNFNASTGDLSISGGNKVTLPIANGGDNWGSQTVVVDQTLTGNGTANSPLSVVSNPLQSLWQKSAGSDDIYYNDGSASMTNLNKDILTWNPDKIRFEGENHFFETELTNGELNLSDVGKTFESRYTTVGTVFSHEGNKSLLSADSLVLRDSFDRRIVSFSRDSLYMTQQIGLLYPDVVSMRPDQLRYERLYGGLKSQLQSGSISFENDDHQSLLNPYQLAIWETSQSQPFYRLIASGDSLQLYNAAKWKTVDVQSNNEYGGSIQLFNPSGTKTLSFGQNRDHLQIDGPDFGGRMSIYDHLGKAKLNANVFDGAAFMSLFSDTSYMFSERGQITIGQVTGAGDFQVIQDPNVILGYDEKNDLGHLQLFGGSQKQQTVFLGSTLFEPTDGQLCLFSTGSDIEKVCARASAIDGGEFSLNGSRFTKFYAGGAGDKGRVYIGDDNGLNRAGMDINEFNQSRVYTRDGTFLVEDINGNPLSGMNNAEIWVGQRNGILPAVLGIDHFSSAGAAYLLLSGENDLPNVFLGKSGSQSYQNNIGAIKLYDGNGAIGAQMDGEGNIEGKAFKLIDQNQQTRFQIGYYFGGSIFAHLTGNSQRPVVAMDAGDDGESGKIVVNDREGNAKAGIFVDPATGNGHMFAQVKNFREDHPTDSSKEIWYAAIEGPEAAIYQRGQAQLNQGSCFIPFDDHFKLMFVQSSATVQLTPRHWDTFGLAVTEITEDGFFVKELKGGVGNFSFDWEVKAVRKGYEDFQPIRNK